MAKCTVRPMVRPGLIPLDRAWPLVIGSPFNPEAVEAMPQVVTGAGASLKRRHGKPGDPSCAPCGGLSQPGIYGKWL